MKAISITGWGRFPVGKSHYLPLEAFLKAKKGPAISRGRGRSYGDSAFCSKGYTIDLRNRNCFLAFDESTGILVTESGLSLYEIIQTFLPRGWFPAVVPGTQFVSVGGAIASNIHGKNHHLSGAFADYVVWLDLLLANGEIKRVYPTEALFWATAGGMGLTGIILRAALRLEAVPTSWVYNTTYKVRDWEEGLRLLEEKDNQYPFAVAWVDHQDRRGRSVIHLGRWAQVDELKPHQNRYAVASAERLAIPFTPPLALFNGASIPLIAEWYWLKNPAGTHIVPYHTYFFPLDGIREWNRLWGPSGFIQFQFVVPSLADLGVLWEQLRRAPARSFLTVLKRLGPQKGPLAFSGPGWTLAIDLPNTFAVRRHLLGLLEEVAARKGKIYLTKDSLLTPEYFRAMYPEWQAFLHQKALVDPQGLWQSDQSQRLQLLS